MTYRSDVDALAARKAALDTEVAERTRERDETARMLEQARRLVLDNLRVASPCEAKWADMSGDDRVRTCAQCDKQVFDLSALTRAQAEALIVEKQGSLCVTYFQRQDGTILLADCELGARRRKRRRHVAISAVAALGVGVATLMASDERVVGERVERIAGSIGGISGPVRDHPRAPACDEFREAVFALDDCDSAFDRAELRGAYVDLADRSRSADATERADAETRCEISRHALEPAIELCKHPLK